MKHWYRIVACMLLLALPLQGIAALAPVMPCDDGKAAAHQAAATPENHLAGTPHHHTGKMSQHPDNGHTESSATGHSCCHHVATALLPAMNAGTPDSTLGLPGRVQLLITLYIPDLPQRPPRA